MNNSTEKESLSSYEFNLYLFKLMSKRFLQPLLFFSLACALLIACKEEEGCTDELAINYSPIAEVDDGSCQVCGCQDWSAENYNEKAACTSEIDTCRYQSEVFLGDYIGTAYVIDWIFFDTIYDVSFEIIQNPIFENVLSMRRLNFVWHMNPNCGKISYEWEDEVYINRFDAVLGGQCSSAENRINRFKLVGDSLYFTQYSTNDIGDIFFWDFRGVRIN